MISIDTAWQFISIISLLVTGLVVAFIHDIYRALIKAMRIKGIVFAVAEIIFAFVVFIFVSAVMVWLTSGTLRPIYLISIIVGIIFYYLIWGKRIQNVLKRFIIMLKRVVFKIVGFIVRVCYVIGRIITWPLEAVFKITTCIANGFTCIMKIKR
ncbi:hypothetical protein IMX26_13695 [Clostridium sp. 'deep sea']|uniref:spore cortex biosynthesis protein YabQ n=1 Tax=Clostridium sp. 'deep sea' TaxID=2779445 RepID=UPI00189685AD|nr:spore cortex biosynthesis protein YabQ [Clostridium sp. 'deep sea']QOR34520.1 hypothetical protein IMX26_13695 [Clostridium sp. 'deep sea']